MAAMVTLTFYLVNPFPDLRLEVNKLRAGEETTFENPSERGSELTPLWAVPTQILA